MNQETRSNISAWARRFGVEINNYERAVEAADRIYGGTSRKGALVVVAMKVTSKLLGKPMGDPVVFQAAAAVATAVYNAAYVGGTQNVYATYREYLNTAHAQGHLNDDQRIEVGVIENRVMDAALDALAARVRERTRPSIANAIIRHVRR